MPVVFVLVVASVMLRILLVFCVRLFQLFTLRDGKHLLWDGSMVFSFTVYLRFP